MLSCLRVNFVTVSEDFFIEHLCATVSAKLPGVIHLARTQNYTKFLTPRYAHFLEIKISIYLVEKHFLKGIYYRIEHEIILFLEVKKDNAPLKLFLFWTYFLHIEHDFDDHFDDVYVLNE